MDQDSGDEKRRYTRFPNHQLNITVARPGIKGIFRANPTAGCVDFCRTGLQIESDQKLEVSDRLMVDISLDDLALQDLPAEVTACHETSKGRYCYGLKFCFDNPLMQHDRIFHYLLLFEEKLRSDAIEDQTAV